MLSEIASEENVYFEPAVNGKEMCWDYPLFGDTKHIVFPANRDYNTKTQCGGETYYEFHCMSCGAELTDFFRDYIVKEPSDSCPCEECSEAEKRLYTVGMRFIRTCFPCFESENCGKIFGRSFYGEILYLGDTFQSYDIDIGFSKKRYFSGDYQKLANPENKTFHQKLDGFLDNFDAGLADVNEALIAGFFKTFGIVRDSVDFFLDTQELSPIRKGIIPIEETRIPITQANTVCGWKDGDPINNRTILGDVPKWNTVRCRYWKNQALDYKRGIHKESLKYEVTRENISRMEKGLAPQVVDKISGEMESLQLHHEPPQVEGGLFDFVEITKREHVEIHQQQIVLEKTQER